MIKKSLINRIAIKENLSKQRAEMLINSVFETLTDTIKNGEEIEIRGFGSFRIRRTKERPGRNPKTGELAVVPSRWAVKFKPSRCWQIKK